MNKCPFCPLEPKTPWYLEAEDGIIVCKDLNNRKFKYRLLVVGSGELFHRPIEQYSTEEISRFLDLGRKVAEEHIRQEKAKKIADIDMSHLSLPQHWHCQFCLV